MIAPACKRHAIADHDDAEILRPLLFALMAP
jgi:hypothetical protein